MRSIASRIAVSMFTSSEKTAAIKKQSTEINSAQQVFQAPLRSHIARKSKAVGNVTTTWLIKKST